MTEDREQSEEMEEIKEDGAPEESLAAGPPEEDPREELPEASGVEQVEETEGVGEDAQVESPKIVDMEQAEEVQEMPRIVGTPKPEEAEASEEPGEEPPGEPEGDEKPSGGDEKPPEPEAPEKKSKKRPEIPPEKRKRRPVQRRRSDDRAKRVVMGIMGALILLLIGCLIFNALSRSAGRDPRVIDLQDKLSRARKTCGEAEVLIQRAEKPDCPAKTKNALLKEALALLRKSQRNYTDLLERYENQRNESLHREAQKVQKYLYHCQKSITLDYSR